MITAEHPLLQLLALIDMAWLETAKAELRRGAPKYYSEKTLFKVYGVSLLKKLWARRALWGFLRSMPLVAQACGLSRIPDWRTLDEQARPSVRRLAEIGPEAEEQIKVLGEWQRSRVYKISDICRVVGIGAFVQLAAVPRKDEAFNRAP